MEYAATATPEQATKLPMSPFLSLSRNPLRLHMPDPATEPDIPAFTWVAFLLNGDWAAEFDARPGADASILRRQPVIALDLLPLPVACAQHPTDSAEDCPLCIEQWRRARLSQQRVIVPAGAQAYFARRRFHIEGGVPPGIEVVTNWTVIGYERAGAVAQVTTLDGRTLIDGGTVGCYLCIDDSGRVLLTDDLAVIG